MGFLAFILAVASFIVGIVVSFLAWLLTYLIRKKWTIPYLLFLTLGLFGLLPNVQAGLLSLETVGTSGHMNVIGGLSVLAPVTLVLLLYWLLAVWWDFTDFWLLSLLVTILVPGGCYLAYRYPTHIWVSLIMGLMLLLNIYFFWAVKRLKT